MRHRKWFVSHHYESDTQTNICVHVEPCFALEDATTAKSIDYDVS